MLSHNSPIYVQNHIPFEDILLWSIGILVLSEVYQHYQFQNYAHVQLLNFSIAIFLVFYAIESLHMFFMLGKCRHFYVVMHTRILGGGACVTMTQMKTKFQVKYSYVTRVCVPKPNLLLGIVHFLHVLDEKEYYTPKMDICIDGSKC